jgi:hypothetical protein
MTSSRVQSTRIDERVLAHERPLIRRAAKPQFTKLRFSFLPRRRQQRWHFEIHYVAIEHVWPNPPKERPGPQGAGWPTIQQSTSPLAFRPGGRSHGFIPEQGAEMNLPDWRASVKEGYDL